MPRRKTPHGKRRNPDAELTRDELTDLWRSGGYWPGSPFVSAADRREAWEKHREQVLAKPHNPGRRPRAFWQYDHPGVLLPYETSLQGLYRLGMLEGDELAELQAGHGWPPEPATGLDPLLVLYE